MQDRLISILERLNQIQLAVLGDFLIDEFLFGEISRVSREAPVLILHYHDTQYCPGGGANTAANVAALGARVLPVGVVGTDSDSDRLLGLWPEEVERSLLIRDPSIRTTRKCRILAGSLHSFRQQVVRLDYEYPVAPSQELQLELKKRIRRAIEQSHGLLISDYSLGSVIPTVAAEAIDLARQRGLPSVVDSRDRPTEFPGATTVTPNIAEVEAALQDRPTGNPKNLEQLGSEALKRFSVEALLVTRGKLGMSLFSPEGIRHIAPYGIAEALDVTGAGDTVAAVYATALAAGARFEEAAVLANLAGGLVVAKKGTATVSAEELAAAVRTLAS